MHETILFWYISFNIRTFLTTNRSNGATAGLCCNTQLIFQRSYFCFSKTKSLLIADWLRNPSTTAWQFLQIYAIYYRYRKCNIFQLSFGKAVFVNFFLNEYVLVFTFKYIGMLLICEYAITYFAKTCLSHIFLHIMAFLESHMRKICRIYHICKNLHIFAYMLHISAYAITFFSIFLVQRCFKTTKYFDGKRLPVFAIRRWINWGQKCQNCAEKAY